MTIVTKCWGRPIWQAFHWESIIDSRGYRNISSQIQHFTVRSDTTSVEIAFCPKTVIAIDKDRRLEQARRTFMRAFGRSPNEHSTVRIDAPTLRVDQPWEKNVLAELRHVDEKVAAIISAPLTAKLVDQILGITRQERLRWYKDGRLPTSGRSVISHGSHRAYVPLFPYDEIAKIAADPSILKRWRRQDSGLSAD